MFLASGHLIWSINTPTASHETDNLMKILEANGAKIPALGLGTWQMRGDQCADIVKTALGTGYRHIDTAVMYENEDAVGQGIKASSLSRDDIFLTTKVWPTDVTEDNFIKTVAGSLERLGTDYVDLLLIHWPPKVNAVADWAKLLNEAAERGWARNIGVSNFTVPLLNEMVAASERPIACNQVENHPYLDQRKIRAACAEHGVALMAYCPLYQGRPLMNNPVLMDIAAACGKTEAQIVLRWHVQHEGAGAIPKTATPSRLAENLDIFDFELPDEQMASITELTSKHSRICDFEFSPKWDAV